MQGWVACGECGTRYDSATFTFCPRCGSTRSSPAGAAGSAAPSGPATAAASPHARRLQAAGVVLLLLGLLAAGLAGYALGPGYAELEATSGALVATQSEGIPGGIVHVLILRDGEPAAANLTFEAMGRTVATAATDGAGRANLTLGSHPAGLLIVAAGGQNLTRNLFVLEGGVLDVRVDVARDAAHDPTWLGLDLVLQVGLWTFLALGALLALAGTAALLRRARWMAYLGPVPALALTLFAASGGLSLGVWAIAATLGGAYAIILASRSAFR